MRNGSCHSKPARVRWEAPSPCGHLHLGVVIGSDQCCTGSAFLRERKLRVVENRKMFFKREKKKKRRRNQGKCSLFFLHLHPKKWRRAECLARPRDLNACSEALQEKSHSVAGTESDGAPCQGRSVVAGSLAHSAAQ